MQNNQKISAEKDIKKLENRVNIFSDDASLNSKDETEKLIHYFTKMIFANIIFLRELN